jgi:hypothetical protein
MFHIMSKSRSNISVIAQLFLVFTFLCAPIADSAHAIRMLQSQHKTTASQMMKLEPPMMMLTTTAAPCHEAMMVSVEASGINKTQTDKPSDKKPCCPHKQCSPNSCLMHFAVAAMPVFEIISHSPIDSHTFRDPDIHLVAIPLNERLRPPIA